MGRAKSIAALTCTALSRCGTLLSNGNQIVPLATSANPYLPGEAITQPAGSSISPDCGAVSLAVAACGANADLFRTVLPGFSDVNSLHDVANSTYHSFQTSATRTLGALIISVVSYSHSIDDSSDRGDVLFVNAYDTAANRARSIRLPPWTPMPRGRLKAWPARHSYI